MKKNGAKVSDYDNLKESGKINETYGSLKTALEMLSISNCTTQPTADQYNKLREKFEQAMQIIEVQKAKLDEIQAKKLPTKDEVESMSAMLDILNKLDIKTIDKLTSLGEKGK